MVKFKTIMSRPFKFLTFVTLLLFALLGIVWAYFNNEPASLVLGQGSFTTSAPATTQNGVNGSFGVGVDSSHLYIADTANSRVLIYNPIPVGPGVNASYVMGQTIFTTATSGAAATLMSHPHSVFSDGVTLFVGDYSNNRVLVFTSIPTANGAAANWALGQGSLISSAIGSGNTGMNSPDGVFEDGARIYVADSLNNRILIYSQPVTTVPQIAVSVLGQTTFSTTTSGSGAGNLNQPHGVYVDSGG